jgi:ABC-type sulfate transport system permease component
MENKPKVKLKILFISVIYCFVCFLVFILIVKVGINLLKFGELRFTQQSFKDSLVVSGIVGVAAGVGSWIFAKIDEYIANKKSSSNEPPKD